MNFSCLFAFELLYLWWGVGFKLQANYVDLVKLVGRGCFVHVYYMVSNGYHQLGTRAEKSAEAFREQKFKQICVPEVSDQ